MGEAQRRKILGLPPRGSVPGMPQREVNIETLESVKCKNPECSGHTFFCKAYEIKIVPSVLSGSGREELVPVEKFFCVKCGADIGIVNKIGG